jgi:predicted dehydrogenase
VESSFRFGLIGAGKHGSRYGRHIRDDCPGLRVSAVCRRNPEGAADAARELGAQSFTSYRELIESGEVDAVVVAVPPALHVEIVSCAAEARVPVLLEKPAAVNLSAGRQIQAVLRDHPIPLMVAQTLRYNGVVRTLRARLEEIGPIRALALTQRFEPSSLDWIDDPQRAGGGMTLLTGVHLFDLVRHFAGSEPQRVTCQMERVHTHHTEDSFAATLRLADGALASVSSSRTAAGRGAHIELAGERGTLVGDHVLQLAYKVVGTKREPIELGAPVPTVRDVVIEFSSAVREKRPVPVSFAEGLRNVAVAAACYEAARTRSTAAVESISV